MSSSAPDDPVRYVLVHGGGNTGRIWDRLRPLLDGPSLAVDLPGRADRPGDLASLTVDDEVASVVTDIESASASNPEPVVLVAHSSGGLVVPGVVSRLGDRIGAVVLNAALVPPEGGTGLDCMQAHYREGLEKGVADARRDGRVITMPGAPDDPESLRRAYGGEPLDDDTLAFVADPVRCVPDTVEHYFSPVRWSAAAGVPVTYVVNDADRPVPVSLQEEMLGRLPSPPRVVRLPGGHIPAVTDPRALASFVVSAAR